MKQSSSYIPILKKVSARVLKWIGLALVGLFLMAGGLFFAIQTEYATDLLIGFANRSVFKEKGIKVDVKNIEGLIPFRFEVGEINISDRSGSWLRIHNFSVSVATGELLKGRLFFERLYAGKIKIERLPYKNDESPKRMPESFTLPPIISRITVKNVNVPRIDLDSDILGTPAQFRLVGGVAGTGEDKTRFYTLELARIDTPDESLRASISLRKNKQHMDLKIDIREPGQGILYQLTGIGEDFKCLLDGSGDLSDWKGKLNASCREVGEISSDIRIKAVKDYNLNLSGYYLFAENIVKEKYHGITGRGVDFKLNADLMAENEIQFNILELKSGEVEAGLKGSIRSSDLNSDINLKLAIKDLSCFEHLTEEIISGSLSVEGTLKGKLFRPEIDLIYSLSELSNSRVSAEEIKGAGHIRFPEENRSKEIMTVSGEGNISEFVFKNKDQEFHEEKITYRFDLTQNDSGQLNVKTFSSDSGSFSALASGYVDYAKKQAHVTGKLDAKDLGRFQPDSDSALKGSGTANFELEADLIPVSVNGFVRGVYYPLPDSEDLKKILGGDVRFEGRINLADEIVRFSEVAVDSRSVSLKGKGKYDLKGSLDAEAALFIPEFNIVSTYFDKSIGGRGTIRFSARGELNNLKITSDTEIEKLIWDYIEIGDLSATVTGVHKDKQSKGKITIDISGDQTVKTGADISMTGRDITLKNIYFSMDDTEASGSIIFDRQDFFINGKLNLSSADISGIAELYGQKIKGAANGEVVFKSEKSIQNIEISTSVQNLILEEDMVESIDLKGTLTDVFDNLYFTAQAVVKGYNHNEFNLDTVNIKGNGKREKAEFYLNGEGTAGEKLAFEASVNYVDKGESKAINIMDMKCDFGSSQVRLIDPLNINYAAEATFIEDINIQIDSGTVKGLFKYDVNEVNGNLLVENVPLTVLALTGMPSINGALDGSLELSGSPSMPDVSADIKVNGISKDGLVKGRIPPLFLEAGFNVNNNSLTGNFRLDGFSESSLNGNITLPCEFSISPFAVAVKDKAPVKGSLKGIFDLSLIDGLFEIQDHLFAGTVDSSIDIAGTYNFPLIIGEAGLSDGRYESTKTGILLNNIDAEVMADNSGLILRSFKADDGSKGRVNASGHLNFDSQKGFLYEITVALKSMQLTFSDMLRTVIDGNTAFSGTKNEHNITGKLTVERADFQIEEKLPVEITELEIKEINKKSDIVPAESRMRPVESKIKFDLAVSSPGKVNITGMGMDSEWKGDLKVEGTAREPVITGKLSLVRGSYSFLSRSFTLINGDVTFLGNSPPDPYFDVTGKNVSGELTAFINLTGSIKSLVLTLTSEPALPQDEILARVLFGRSVSQITPLQAIRLAGAVNEMMGGRSFDPLDYTKKLIGVDRLEIKQSEANPDDSAVSAGKYLKDNIYIEVEKGISTENTKASVTWELTPNITVETEVGEDSETGMGINWKYDY